MVNADGTRIPRPAFCASVEVHCVYINPDLHAMVAGRKRRMRGGAVDSGDVMDRLVRYGSEYGKSGIGDRLSSFAKSMGHATLNKMKDGAFPAGFHARKGLGDIARGAYGIVRRHVKNVTGFGRRRVKGRGAAYRRRR